MKLYILAFLIVSVSLLIGMEQQKNSQIQDKHEPSELEGKDFKNLIQRDIPHFALEKYIAYGSLIGHHWELGGGLTGPDSTAEIPNAPGS